MKKALMTLALLCAVMALSCASALAQESGMRNVATQLDSVTATPRDAGGNPVAAVNGDYANAEAVLITYTEAQTGQQYLILALNSPLSSGAVPVRENIIFIDQTEEGGATGGNLSFNVFPESLSAGSYYIIMSSDAASGSITDLTQVASFDYYEGSGETGADDVLYGDVTGDGNVNINDVMEIINYIVGNRTLSPQQLQAADVDRQSGVNINDVMAIINFIVGNRTTLGE